MARRRAHRRRRFSLEVQRLVEVGSPERRYYADLRVGENGCARRERVPVSDLAGNKLVRWVADHCGHVLDRGDPRLRALRHDLERVPRIRGTSTVGWTDDHRAFAHGRKVFTLPSASSTVFVRARSTILGAAPFEPQGSREEQYCVLRSLWRHSGETRLMLSLGFATPFLELVGLPTFFLHVAGKTGWAKTTMAKLAVSIFANPAALGNLDAAKDTRNFLDAMLSEIRNFPVLFDETTTSTVAALEDLTYAASRGRSKGRLGGSATTFSLLSAQPYSLVVFLTGEIARRPMIAHGGAVARWSELALTGPLIPPRDANRLHAFANQHFGWVGRDALTCVFSKLLDGHPDSRLMRLYQRFRTALHREEHGRITDLLAAIALGYYVGRRQLFDGFETPWRWRVKAAQRDAIRFAEWADTRLSRESTPVHVIDAIRTLAGIAAWAGRGYIPLSDLKPIIERFKLTSSVKLLRMLQREGIVSHSQPRQIPPHRESKTCYILTADGKARLLGG